MSRRFLPLLILCLIVDGPVGGEECTYSTWVWNTKTARSEQHGRVKKDRADLTPAEKDPHSDCTVCEQDQVEINLSGVPLFQVCQSYADSVRQAMEKIQASGFPLISVVAYRVGKSKGPVDAAGRRTEFSHHSFGTAIDINAEKNGLYTDCVEFGPDCRLLRGGPWKPGEPGTLTKQSFPTRVFENMGWGWGGDLEGRQKDFMHFSLTGN